MRTERQKWMLRTLLFCLGTILITIIAFEQVRDNRFVYDDLLYITHNPNVADGLSVESVKWAFTTTYGGNWHPVTWLSHILDCELFGLEPFWPHLENLLLHILNALLLFWILRSMTGAFWRSAFLSVIFAVHPIHVESVAWAAERKDLLCGLFWMLTTIAYIKYARKPCFGGYLLVIIFFVLGLMSKPMIVTLPFVLLLMDYWPLARFEKLQPDGIGNGYKKTSARFLFAEKLPLFVLAAASSVVTFIVQRAEGAMDMLEPMAFDIRIANALVSYITYISKMIYPSRLAVMYPHPGGELELWYALTSLSIIILVSIIALRLGRRNPYFVLGWSWYLGTLVPVIGFVQVGVQSMADRYSYLPSIGFFIIIVWGAAKLAERRRFLKIATTAAAFIIIFLLVACTRKQVQHWKDNFTLFERALLVTEDSPEVLYNMGVVMQTEHNFDLALQCYREALRQKTDYFQASNNIGNILRQQGKFDEAASYIYRALEINSKSPQAHNNLGLVLAAQGNFGEAVVHFRQAVEIAPDLTGARQNLAAALQSSGQYDEAIKHYREILRLNPGHLPSLKDLADILIVHPVPEQRNPAEAIWLAERAAELTKHKSPVILETLAAAYAATGQFDRAVTTIQEAINMAPDTSRFNEQLEKYKQGKLPEELIQEQDTHNQ